MKRAMTQTSATAVTDADPILNELRGLLGARGVTTDTDAMEPWLTDWRGRYHGKARALVPTLTRSCRSLHSAPALHAPLM